ncbi:myrosinase 1-like [Xylocopa sonorina]|uniref:myrosinase 1-like n=1 Tax=Xylocopa sonorina TaxID=1818115 RepID=UPI00403AF686
MIVSASFDYSVLFLLLTFVSCKSEEWLLEHQRFPPKFLLGNGGSAYQIEGAWNVSDKAESMWDRFVRKQGTVIDNETADVTADSYHKYKEDIAISKRLGFTSFRFSICWSRILPTGLPNRISKDGVEYYHNVIDEILLNNMVPLVTIYHWDHPQILEEAGGWYNPEMVDWYGDYASVVFREFGTKVKRFTTINEPLILCTLGYMNGTLAPGKHWSGLGEYICMHNVIKAHARAYRIYESQFKAQQKGEVGASVMLYTYFPATPDDQFASNLSFTFNLDWFLHPIFSKEGDYPPLMKRIVMEKSRAQGYPRSRLPTFDAYWIDYIRGTYDFLAVNHYTSKMVTIGDHGQVPSHENDQGVIFFAKSSWKTGSLYWLYVVPEGIRYGLYYIARNYNNPPMYVTENGYPDYGTLNDVDRISYFREYLKQLLLGIYIDGLDIRGYYIWSFLDCFEWNSGYRHRFGIVSVDFNDPDRPRTLKKSALWWKRVNAARKIL